MLVLLRFPQKVCDLCGRTVLSVGGRVLPDKESIDTKLGGIGSRWQTEPGPGYTCCFISGLGGKLLTPKDMNI